MECSIPERWSAGSGWINYCSGELGHPGPHSWEELKVRDDAVSFRTGSHRPAERFEAVKAWLTEQGFDINEIPLDSLVSIEDGKVTVEVYARNAEGRLSDIRSTHTRPLVSEPDDLVLGVTGA